MLGDGDGAPGDGEVVIGGKQGDQAEGKATDGLGEAEPVKPEGADASLGAQKIPRVWRKRRRFAVRGQTIGRWSRHPGARSTPHKPMPPLVARHAPQGL